LHHKDHALHDQNPSRTKGGVVISPNEFWLHLHILAEAYAAEGSTHDKRVENIAEQFHKMPRVTQRELVADLTMLMGACPDLYGLVAGERAERPAQRV
jgi:hypothetical protein